jgi:phosphoribosylaminoimidazolecarboxamide formyltransferase / IMP cyclohydrolase
MNHNHHATKRALVSVADKSGLKELLKGLIDILPGLEIIASEGTAKVLKANNIPHITVRDYSGFPECFEGRVKTLHPRIAGGILMRRGIDDQEASLLSIDPIDLVICNLYDFQRASLKHGLSLSQLMDAMDIGGSALIRSACKNYKNVTVVVDPKDYPLLLHELRSHAGTIPLATREKMAVKGINASADYESLLVQVLGKRMAKKGTDFPRLTRGRKLSQDNDPNHQAWIYQFHDQENASKAEILGKELSSNNYLDATAAYQAAQELQMLGSKHGVAVIKQGSLCAYATGNSLKEAFEMAWEGDSKSAYGSVIASTSPITNELRDEIKNKFVEVLIAPDFESGFIEWAIQSKKRLRLVKIPNGLKSPFCSKHIKEGLGIPPQMLKQTLTPENFNLLFKAAIDRIDIVTKPDSDKNLYPLFAFALSAVNYAKSNAVAIVREPKPGCYQLIAMGAGLPNRVDSLERLAIPKAIENLQHEHGFDPNYDPKKDLEKCVLASDSVFPLDEGVRFAASSGLRYCIQPGGSKWDEDVIRAANETGMCMVMAGSQYFFP